MRFVAALLILTASTVASAVTLASYPYVGVAGAQSGTRTFPGTISGVWRGTLLFQGPPFRIERFDTNLRCDYRVDEYRFGLQANMLDSVLRTVSLTGAGPVGDAFRVDSVLRFDPQVPAFRHWRATTRFSLLDTDITHLFHLADDPEASFTQLQTRGALEDLSFDTVTRFSLSPLKFAHHLVRLRGQLTVCDLSWQGELRLTKDGFDHASILLRDMHIPWASFGNLDVYVNLETKFTEDSKSVTPRLTLRSAWECCVRGYLALESDTGGFSITGIEVQGFEVRLTLVGGTELRGATAFVPERNGRITGFSEYFEMLMLTGPIRPCCENAPGRWQLAVYFSGSDELFGWGMTRFVLEFPVSSNTRLFSRLSARAVTSPWQWEWRAGWTIRF
ncbi:MAG: hypothetical protein R6U88_00010 [Candidatus Bipolaricaulota bacterium]